MKTLAEFILAEQVLGQQDAEWDLHEGGEWRTCHPGEYRKAAYERVLQAQEQAEIDKRKASMGIH